MPRATAQEFTLRQVDGAYNWSGLLRLLRDSFAYMEGRIDPPSSMHGLTIEGITRMALEDEIWVIENEGAAVACVFLTVKPGRLYIGKLAVAHAWRGRGLARHLVACAERRAADLGLPQLELQTRIELIENHGTFAAMGFRMTGESAHEGFDHPTSLTFSRRVRAAS